ncbi:MAG: methyltransferase [Solirubrobacterales bacterium]|nr:methyltransferase [Solirubrobacterales bacterium]
MLLLPLPGVFQPPSDAWMLVRCLREEPPPAGASALDLGTGSGVLAIAAAQAGCGEVVAVDVSRRALLAVRLNARLNGVRVRALHGDLFAPVAGQRFDLIVSNPPYVPSPQAELPRRGLARAWEAGHDGRDVLDRICSQADAYLRPGGRLLLVHSALCGETATLSMLRERGLHAEVALRHQGELGPILRARAPWLHQQGLLAHPAERAEEMLVIKAERPAKPPSPHRDAVQEANRLRSCSLPSSPPLRLSF